MASEGPDGPASGPSAPPVPHLTAEHDGVQPTDEEQRSTGTAWRVTGQGWRARLESGLLVLTAGAFLVGLGAQVLDRSDVADACWIAGTLVAVVPASAWVVLALRAGRARVDLLAVVSLLGTLAVGEYLAGSLIAVMVATGRALDAAAERRASRDLRALLERVPRSARRRTPAHGSTAQHRHQHRPAGRPRRHRRCATRRRLEPQLDHRRPPRSMITDKRAAPGPNSHCDAALVLLHRQRGRTT
jgi:hypothetical protein